MIKKYKLPKRTSIKTLSKLAIRSLHEEGPDGLWRYNNKVLKVLVGRLNRQIEKIEQRMKLASDSDYLYQVLITLEKRTHRLTKIRERCELHLLERAMHNG